MIVWVEFLGAFGAADVSARNQVEWPPHPDRLFQALVDAAGGSEQAGLQWLEEQQPPSISCGEAVPLKWGRDGTAFVPVNYPRAGLPDEREKQPRVFPMAFPRRPVAYVWPEPPASVFDSLRKVAARVTHVGRSDSLAMVSVESGNVETQWVPHPRGELSLRIPHRGRLAELDQSFTRGQRSSTAPSAAYGSRRELTTQGPWADMVSVRLRRPLSVQKVTLATEALRKAVLSRMGDDAPALVHGHGRHDHIAWLGLPNLSPYRAGELLGLAVAFPATADPVERAACVAALLRVEHIMVAGQPVSIDRPSSEVSLKARTWSQTSREWVSVTPVVLDRHPRRSLTPEQVVSDSFVRAGYVRPNDVELLRESALALPGDRRFRLRKEDALFCHVRAAFDRPLAGPVLVGAQRYFGLGLFMPQELARTGRDDGAGEGSRNVLTAAAT